MAFSSSAGRAVSTIQPRISLPPATRASTSSTSSVRQPFGDALGQAALFEVLLESVGGGGETAGHGNPQLGQVADHLAERRIFAADLSKVGHAQLVEPKHQVVQGSLLKSSI